MPPRRRQREDDEKPTPRPRPTVKADGPICAECWPNGWPEHAKSGACAHGAYQRNT